MRPPPKGLPGRWLLAQHPDAVARLAEEIAQVMADRDPGTPINAADLPTAGLYAKGSAGDAASLSPRLDFSTGGQGEDEIGGYQIPAGSLIFPCQFSTHRHPEFWREPERFDPDRFASGREETQRQYAYYPFGGGPRLCVGTHFAGVEGPLILAAVAQRFGLRLAASAPVAPKSAITLDRIARFQCDLEWIGDQIDCRKLLVTTIPKERVWRW